MGQNEAAQHLRSCVQLVPIFNHLDDETMTLISERVQHQHFAKGEFIYRAQESDDSLYIVHRGSVRIFRLSEAGREQLVRILQPGDFTGEWTIFNENTVHEDYAQAAMDTEVCRLHQDDVQALLRAYPAVAIKLLQQISARLAQSERQTTQVATEQVGSRIALFLAEQVSSEMGAAPVITLPMARKDIASYLGTTPETVSRKFKQLETEGLIQQLSSKQIKINDMDNLLLFGD